MAHFAKISEENIVLSVHAVDDGNAASEEKGAAFLERVHGWPEHLWIQTSYNTQGNQHKLGGTPFRFNMPEIGYTYDSLRDGFIPPKPGNDYILIERKSQWSSMIDWTSQYREQVKLFRSDV